MKNLVIAIIVLLLIGGVGTILYLNSQNETSVDNVPSDTAVDAPMPVPDADGEEPVPEMIVEEEGLPASEVIGTSAGGNDIVAHHFGTGEKEVLFIGGVHGGYSFNTALVAYELIDYLENSPNAVPDNVTVTVIPVMNPDGLEEVVGTTGRFEGSEVTAGDEARIAGRFNANDVDLNRNFDCKWQTVGTWQSRQVSGGETPFSEPEAAALRDYVQSNNPAAAVVYYSQAGGVFSSSCNNGISPETVTLTNLYAEAAGYPAYEEFDFYEITGDMVNWMASENIPAISVLLSDHENAEWNKNRVGIEAILNYYAE